MGDVMIGLLIAFALFGAGYWRGLVLGHRAGKIGGRREADAEWAAFLEHGAA